MAWETWLILGVFAVLLLSFWPADRWAKRHRKTR
jgi:positive regulator of sigma E activity